jgi:hypothetical protein
MKIELKFVSNAATLWAHYLIAMKDFVYKKMLNAGFIGFEVDLTINSLFGDIDIYPQVGFSSDVDWITIDDCKDDEICKRIFIYFASIDDNSGIRFEFLEGPNNDENLRLIEISEMRFNPEILENEKIYAEFAKWFRGEEINIELFKSHAQIQQIK